MDKMTQKQRALTLQIEASMSLKEAWFPTRGLRKAISCMFWNMISL